MRSRVKHAERYAITSTQEQLDARAERKLQRTGPRHGQRLAQEMRLISAGGHGRKLAAARHIVAARHGQRLAQEMRLISAGGHGRKLAAARHIVAAQERNLRDELDDMRKSIAQRHDPKLTRRYADPVGSRRDAVKAGLRAQGVL